MSWRERPSRAAPRSKRRRGSTHPQSASIWNRRSASSESSRRSIIRDSAHLHLTGTGLTHLGSAEGRDKMHRAAAAGSATDSMRMFLMGVEGGKPRDGEVGVQPEWFYKGDGSSIVAPGAAIPSPDFALDGSEEPEIAGIYLIDGDGQPRRLGYCLANEFSDHVTERANYLVARAFEAAPAALGPELLTGKLPPDVRGTSRIVREGRTLWEKPFLTGEANMSHSLRNLEHHHFKYALFRRPGDVHVHFFGTATLSFAAGIQVRDGDVFEIAAQPFRLPLRNPMARADSRQPAQALYDSRQGADRKVRVEARPSARDLRHQ